MSRHHGRRGSLSAAALTAGRSRYASGNLERQLTDETESDITMEELQEFMSADFFEVPADPAFKNRLRKKLWELVEANAFGCGPPNKPNEN